MIRGLKVIVSGRSYLISNSCQSSLELTPLKVPVKLECIDLRKNCPAPINHYWITLALTVVILAATNCAVKRTTKVAVPQLSPPPVEASAEDLVGRINAQADKIQTLTATVDFEPTAGSVYSGVIKEYHDVKGFILLKKPALIRVIGQAPIIRTNIFDMVSDGETFRLNIPPKHKFIVGKTSVTRPAKNALENLRPQHILDALLVQPIDQARDKLSFEEAEDNGHRYYVLTVFQPGATAVMFPERKIWFDGSSLDEARLQFYGPQGNDIEDVQYSNYQDFQGARYPTLIQITRPVEDYRLTITILKAVFNQEITPDKFDLKKPEGAQLVELSAVAQPGEKHGK